MNDTKQSAGDLVILGYLDPALYTDVYQKREGTWARAIAPGA